jgi:hypothetical protein
MLAVECFCQGAGERFEFFKLMAGEQIGVAEPPARQRTLQKLDALGLRGIIFESHAAVWRITDLVSRLAELARATRKITGQSPVTATGFKPIPNLDL